MSKVLIGAATLFAGAALAAPASAQYYPVAPQVPQYANPYGSPYGYGYGQQGSFGQVRILQARVHQLKRQIREFDRRNVISGREAQRLRREANNVEHRLVHASRFGLDARERFEIERRIVRLEQRIWREARDGRNWGRYGYGYGSSDGRWDREHDRWHDRHDDDDHDD